jgi:molybdopterin synthase catalytic subunit
VVDLTSQPIDVTRTLALVQQPEAGAVVLFLGITRQFTAGRETTELAYEAYSAMALSELQKLETNATDRWELTAVAIVHRLGVVPVGEPSVAIAVSSPHRDAAFAAGKWMIDELKSQVPIWKQEHWTDGTREWVHPC